MGAPRRQAHDAKGKINAIKKKNGKKGRRYENWNRGFPQGGG